MSPRHGRKTRTVGGAVPYSPRVSIANVLGFVRPADLEVALAAVRDGAIAVSGGTDVMLHAPTTPRLLVDLTVLPLSGISQHEGGITVGATTTLS